MATLTITERGTTDLPPSITIVRVQEFLRTPFPGFAVRRVPNHRKVFTVTIDREHAIFVGPSASYTTQIDGLTLRFENHTSPCFSARTEEDLARLATILFNKPLYVMAKCKVQVGEQYEWNTRVRQFVATDFVVRLETETDNVRAQLMRLFEKARNCIRRGKRFYTKIDMNRVIRTWFERNAARRVFTGTSSASGAHFGFSNASEPCCQGTCGACLDDPGVCVCATLFCFPFALLCCLPYCVYRKALFKDRTHYIAGDVKIGYNVTISADELLELIDRFDRNRMREEHERLYGPMGSQPPPYSISAPAGAPAGSPARPRTASSSSRAQAAPPAYGSRPAGVEEPPPYSENEENDERVPILSAASQ